MICISEYTERFAYDDIKKPTVIDLCCGAGGFSEGFKQAGFDIIYAVDIWETAIKTHEINHPNAVHEVADVTKLKTVPKCYVMIGSPPCQCFSVQKYARPDNKKVDLSIFETFNKLLHMSEATFYVWENTPLSAKHVNLPHNFLDAQDYGVPQRRKRVFYGNYPMPVQQKTEGEIAPTIVAWELSGGWKNANGRRFSQWLNRKPTYQEMAKYMGFPSTYAFEGTQHEKSLQIGNAVCPPVAKAIAEEIKKVYYNPELCTKRMYNSSPAS